MADKKIKVGIDIDVNAEPSIAQLKALKKELKNAAAGSEEFNKIYNQIDDLEDKIKSAKNTSADWIDTLASAGGPLGALGGALNKLKVSTQSFGAALKATGIGLIVGLLGGLVGAFSQTEGAMKKFEPLLIAMEQIFGGLLEALQPVIDGFIELAINVMPYVTQAFKVVYSAVTAVFQSLGKLGGAIVKLFKGDFKGAWADAKESVTAFSTNYDSAVERFEKGAARMTKTQKENAKNAQEAADKAKEALLKQLEAQDKYDEAMLEKMKQQTLALATTEQQKLDIEKEFAKKAYDLKQKDLDEKIKLEKKNSPEYKALQAEKIALDAEYIAKVKDFSEQQKKIIDDDLKSQKEFNNRVAAIRTQAIADDQERAKQAATDKYNEDLANLELDKEFIKKSEEEKAKIRENLLIGYNNTLAKIDRDAKLEQMNNDLELLTAQQKTLTEGSQAYLDNSIAIENEAYQIKVANAKNNATKIKAIETEHAQNLKDIHLKAFIAEKEIQLGRLQVAASIGNSLGQLAGKNKALAIAGLVIGKAAAIGEIWVNNSIANAKATAASPLTFGQPWVTINTISAVLGTAAAIASGVQAINEINAVQTPGGGSGGSAGGSSAPPSLPTVTAASAPQINTSGGQDPTSRIGETIGSAQKPIQAYVVSQEVSSQQALDRRTNRAATLSGG